MDSKYDSTWEELGKLIYDKKVKEFFDQIYFDINKLYKDIGSPNGKYESDMWEWCKEQLFESRGRAINSNDNLSNWK